MTDFFTHTGGPWKKAKNRDFAFLRIWVFLRKIKKHIADSNSAQNFGLEKLFEIFQSEKSRIRIIPLKTSLCLCELGLAREQLPVQALACLPGTYWRLTRRKITFEISIPGKMLHF